MPENPTVISPPYTVDPGLQRRAAQRLKLNLERYETASESSDDERSAAAPAGGRADPEVLAVYESGGVTTTVTAIAMNSDRCIHGLEL